MPWKECNIMNERMKFVLRLDDGERMSDLCREFGISRKTGYKIWNRYNEGGLDGLFDESKKPLSNPNQTPESVERIILKLKKERETWGPTKLREYLMKKHRNISFPSRNTFHNILLKNDLVKRRRKRTYKATGTNLRKTDRPNDLWCADFKGQFKMKSGKYCYPLTITDHFSRYLLTCDALESVKTGGAYSVFQAAFEEYGLPEAIRTDNGVPFCSPNALLGLSRLSVWWLRLGIHIERIRPGNPQENGRHERMHLTLKQDTLRDPKKNILAQQEIFDRFKKDFNMERPHQGINNKTPGSLYKKSREKYEHNLKEIKYLKCDTERTIALNGKLSFANKHQVHIGECLSSQPVGLTEIDDFVWRIQFMNIVIGHYDQKDGTFAKMKEIVTVDM